MPVESTCYYRLTEDGNWKAGSSGRATLGKGEHAERYAYRTSSKGGAKLFKFEQNDFPCKLCTQFFLDLSAGGYEFEFVCSGNQGGYAVECGYLPDGHADKFKPTLAGTLKIINQKIYGRDGTATLPKGIANSQPAAVQVINPPEPKSKKKKR